jgi:hypothetical protein
MDKIAAAMQSVATAMATPETSAAMELLASPQCRTAAVCALEAEGDLSVHDQVKLIRLFQCNTAVADSYLAIKNKATRDAFIHSERYDI